MQKPLPLSLSVLQTGLLYILSSFLLPDSHKSRAMAIVPKKKRRKSFAFEWGGACFLYYMALSKPSILRRGELRHCSTCTTCTRQFSCRTCCYVYDPTNFVSNRGTHSAHHHCIRFVNSALTIIIIINYYYHY